MTKEYTMSSDIHICGLCRLQFTDIELFVDHKKNGCSVETLVTTQPVTTTDPLQANVIYNKQSPGGPVHQSPDLQSGMIQSNVATCSSLYGNDIITTTTGQADLRGISSILNPSIGVSPTSIFGLTRTTNVFQSQSPVIHSTVTEIPTRSYQSEQQTAIDNLTYVSTPNTLSTTNTLAPISTASPLVETLGQIQMGNLQTISRSLNDSVNLAGLQNVATSQDLAMIGLTTMVDAGVAVPNIGRPSTVQTVTSTNIPRKKRGSQIQGYYVVNNTDQTNEKRFVCDDVDCDYSSSYNKDLQRHRRIHTGEKPYMCDFCNKGYSRKDKLTIHTRSHTGQKPFKCELCDYAAADNSSLRKHKRAHTGERPYKCQICPYASKNSSQLTIHLRIHTGDSPFVCQECSACFKVNSDLKRHTRTHTGEKPYKCDYCDFKCAVKGNLKPHVKINHAAIGQLKCDACEFVTSSKKGLQEHRKCHDEDQYYKCPTCGYLSPNKVSLKIHMTTHAKKTMFKCYFCTFTAKKKDIVQQHTLKKHPEVIKNKKRGKQRLTGTNKSNGVRLHKLPPKPFICTHCSVKFVREDSLRCHMRQHRFLLGLTQTEQTAVDAVLQLQNIGNMPQDQRQETSSTQRNLQDIVSSDKGHFVSTNTLQTPNTLLMQHTTDVSQDTCNTSIQSSSDNRNLSNALSNTYLKTNNLQPMMLTQGIALSETGPPSNLIRLDSNALPISSNMLPLASSTLPVTSNIMLQAGSLALPVASYSNVAGSSQPTFTYTGKTLQQSALRDALNSPNSTSSATITYQPRIASSVPSATLVSSGQTATNAGSSMMPIVLNLSTMSTPGVVAPTLQDQQAQKPTQPVYVLNTTILDDMS